MTEQTKENKMTEKHTDYPWLEATETPTIADYVRKAEEVSTGGSFLVREEGAEIMRALKYIWARLHATDERIDALESPPWKTEPDSETPQPTKRRGRPKKTVIKTTEAIEGTINTK